MKAREEHPPKPTDTRREDIERPLDDTDPRESQEVTDTNIAMNDEFIDAGNESHLEEDAGIDDRAGGPDDPAGDVDTIINGGIVGRSAG